LRKSGRSNNNLTLIATKETSLLKAHKLLPLWYRQRTVS
jgi:hypothetical protein